MSLFVLIVIVGTLNLALGYALAVQMGFGSRTLPKPWETRATGSWDGSAADRSVETAIGELIAKPRQAAPQPTLSTESPPPDAFIEGSVLAFRSELVKNEDSLVRIDADLRSSQTPTALTIEAHTRALQTNGEAYLAELKKASEQFQSRFDELGALKPLGEQIDLALVEQSTQIEAMVRNLGQLDLASDPTAATARLIEEVATLLSAVHQLRDYLDTAYVTIVRQETRRNTIDDSYGTDPMTNLPNRIGLEHFLQQWWQEGRHRTQPHSAALFDLDGFAKLNQDHGASAGNQVLRVVAERMRGCLGPNDLIVRYSGQQIAVLLSGVEAADAVQAAERIRQAAQTDNIPCGEMAIPISLSGGVVEILPHDTPQDVLERLEKALRQAKRTGRGPLALYQGDTAADGDEGRRTKG